MNPFRKWSVFLLALMLVAVVSGCALTNKRHAGPTKSPDRSSTTTETTAAVDDASDVLGEGAADEILTNAAMGMAVGAGAATYLDWQEEQLARIPGTSVERISQDVLVIHFDADVLFEVGSATLNDTSRAALDETSKVFRAHPKTVIVAQGHTDSTGSETFNRELSERRAQAVMNYLVARGVTPTRITALGYGENHPVAGNDSEEGRRQNRRVDLLLKAR